MNHIAIFESQNFECLGESIDEERNQEKGWSEEGCNEEEEVAPPIPF
jgi:hypothetical protein